MFGEVLEEFRNGEEDCGVVLFDCAVFLDAEYAAVHRLVDVVGAQMAFGDELLTEADPAVAVDAGSIEEAVFFDVVPAYFVRAFEAPS